MEWSKEKKDASFKILVTGRFSSGKTALVNNLLGEKLLPEKALPATALITEIHYGKEKKVIMFPKAGMWQGGDAPFEIEPTLSEIEKYSTVKIGFKETDCVYDRFEKMVVYWPLERLKAGVSIIDSPGICEGVPGITEWHQINAYTLEYISKADAVLYCISGLNEYNSHDREALKYINSMGMKPVIVTTFLDYLAEDMSEHEKQEFMDVTFNNYYFRHTEKEYCHYVDSKLGLAAKQNYSHVDYVESGYYELEKHLERMQEEKRRSMKYDECINCAERAIKNLQNIPSEKRKQYEKSIKDIKRRKDDSFLNVALIGDFSTGKSTFINALIKENMLKTSWFATTAIPTHIYYHDKNEIIVKVETSDGTEYDLSERYAKRTVETILKCELPNNINDLITFITTSNELTDNIRLVKVYCRSEEEFRHICIIDTPGVNPGAGDTKSHVMATRNVLREYADAAIVLFQAQQVYTNSFKTFLEENAKHFMDEAVFVITMMDQIDESERSEIIEFVRSSLQETFHLSNPLVFGCCAKYVNKKNANDEEQEWNCEFDRLRRELTGYINRRRKHIIEKQMSLLLENLLKPLEQDIKGNIAVIEKELAILEENSIEKLSGELSANRYLYEHEIEKKLKKGSFEAKYNEMFTNIINSAASSINSCTKVNGDGNNAVSGYMKNGLPALMERENIKLTNEVNQVFSNSEKILKEYYDDNKKIFQKFSINLGRTENYEIQNKKMDSSSVEMEKVSFSGDSGNLIGDGIAVGAILVGSVASLPLAIIDGIFDTDISETVLQTFFGFADGVMNLFSNLSAKKSEAISSVKHSIAKMKESNRDKFMQQIEDRKVQMQNTFVEINSKFEAEYQIIYERRYQQFLKEKDQMECEITKNKVLQKALTAYLEELQFVEKQTRNN